MHSSLITTKRVMLALLVSLLGGCELPESDEDGSAATPQPAPPPMLGTDCSLSPQLAAGATKQALGAYCFGLALLGGDEQLACLPTATNVTQCVETSSGTSYVVQWTGDKGNVYTGQTSLGTVTQQSATSYEVGLTDMQGRSVEPAGKCSLTTTTVGQQAKFCAYVVP